MITPHRYERIPCPEPRCDGGRLRGTRAHTLSRDRRRRATCQMCRGFGYIEQRIKEPKEPTRG